MMPHHLPLMALAAMPAGQRGIKNTERLQLSLLASSSKLFFCPGFHFVDCLICAGTAAVFFHL